MTLDTRTHAHRERERENHKHTATVIHTAQSRLPPEIWYTVVKIFSVTYLFW